MCVSPNKHDALETITTLRFADLSQRIKIRPEVNTYAKRTTAQTSATALKRPIPEADILSSTVIKSRRLISQAEPNVSRITPTPQENSSPDYQTFSGYVLKGIFRNLLN